MKYSFELTSPEQVFTGDPITWVAKATNDEDAPVNVQIEATQPYVLAAAPTAGAAIYTNGGVAGGGANQHTLPANASATITYTVAAAPDLDSVNIRCVGIFTELRNEQKVVRHNPRTLMTLDNPVHEEQATTVQLNNHDPLHNLGAQARVDDGNLQNWLEGVDPQQIADMADARDSGRSPKDYIEARGVGDPTIGPRLTALEAAPPGGITLPQAQAADTAAIAAHVGLADPHPGYATDAEIAALNTAQGVQDTDRALIRTEFAAADTAHATSTTAHATTAITFDNTVIDLPNNPITAHQAIAELKDLTGASADVITSWDLGTQLARATTDDFQQFSILTTQAETLSAATADPTITDQTTIVATKNNGIQTTETLPLSFPSAGTFVFVWRDATTWNVDYITPEVWKTAANNDQLEFGGTCWVEPNVDLDLPKITQDHDGQVIDLGADDWAAVQAGTGGLNTAAGDVTIPANFLDNVAPKWPIRLVAEFATLSWRIQAVTGVGGGSGSTLNGPLPKVGTAVTPATADLDRICTTTDAGAVTLTIEPDITTNHPVGFFATYLCLGAGGLTVAAGAGVTFLGGLTPNLTAAQGERVLLYKSAADEWWVF